MDCIAAKTAPEESAGLSSEHNSLIAALIFPSSTFDVTARERSNGVFFCLEEPDLLSAVAVPEILSLMQLVMLTRWPVRGGLSRTSEAKLINLHHRIGSPDFCTTYFRMAVKAKQQAGRADLGMCLRMGPAGLV